MGRTHFCHVQHWPSFSKFLWKSNRLWHRNRCGCTATCHGVHEFTENINAYPLGSLVWHRARILIQLQGCVAPQDRVCRWHGWLGFQLPWPIAHAAWLPPHSSICQWLNNGLTKKTWLCCSSTGRIGRLDCFLCQYVGYCLYIGRDKSLTSLLASQIETSLCTI